jgi:hypothetical protein
VLILLIFLLIFDGCHNGGLTAVGSYRSRTP